MKSALRLIGLLLSALVPPAMAADYPDRPLQVIVPSTAGGIVDLLARGLADAMGPALGQAAVVVNRDGASNMIGTQATAAAKPDGYTIGFLPVGPMTIQPVLNPTLPFRTASFDPICQTFELTFSIAVKPDSPWTDLKSLLAAARADPARISYALVGKATVPHLAMVALLLDAGVEMTHVPYRGEAPIVTALNGGEVQVAVIAAGLSSAQQLRILGIFRDRRLPDLPQVPTVAELGHPVSYTAFGGLLAPAGLLPPVLARLEAACAAAVKSERYVSAAANARQPVVYRDRAAFKAAIEADRVAMAAVIQRGGITE